MKGKRGKKVNGVHRNRSSQQAAVFNGSAISFLPASGARQLRTVDPRNRRRQRAAITLPPFLQEPSGS